MPERIAEIYAGPILPERAGDDAVWYDTSVGPFRAHYKINGIWYMDDSIRVISGEVTQTYQVEVIFSGCVNAIDIDGIQCRINNVEWFTILVITDGGPGITLLFTISGAHPIFSGDTVDFRYVAGSDNIVDCDNAEDIGAQEITLTNPLVVADTRISAPDMDADGKPDFLISQTPPVTVTEDDDSINIDHDGDLVADNVVPK